MGGSWDVEATVSEPFEDCDDTLVRRISWSPDGQFLVATNSKDGVGSLAWLPRIACVSLNFLSGGLARSISLQEQYSLLFLQAGMLHGFFPDG